MQREMSGIWLWLVLVFLVGVVVGRLGIPLLEPRVTTVIGIGSDADNRGCGYSINQTTTVPWRKEYLEGSLSMKCKEQRPVQGAVLWCRCEGD